MFCYFKTRPVSLIILFPALDPTSFLYFDFSANTMLFSSKPQRKLVLFMPSEGLKCDFSTLIKQLVVWSFRSEPLRLSNRNIVSRVGAVKCNILGLISDCIASASSQRAEPAKFARYVSVKHLA